MRLSVQRPNRDFFISTYLDIYESWRITFDEQNAKCYDYNQISRNRHRGSYDEASCPVLIGTHDDVMTWKHFPCYWPFVRGIHRWPVNSHTKASDAELWGFLWSASESTLKQTMETPVIWGAIALTMTSLWCPVHYAPACYSPVEMLTLG